MTYQDEHDFRQQVRAWMELHLTGKFAALKYRGVAGDECAFPELRREWEQVLANAGWLGMSWPEAFGGKSLPADLQIAFHEEYARAGGPGRLGHIGETLVAPTLIKYGTTEQQQRFLPGILSGQEFWCQGYSEPGAGSDLAAIKTRCWQEDGQWKIRGQKVWTSLAHQSDWIFVLARSTTASVGREGLSFLLVPLDQPGVEIRPIKQMTGDAEFNEVFFDDALTGLDCIVGEPGDGWTIAMALLGFERGLSTLGQQMHFSYELDLVIQSIKNNRLEQDPAIRKRLADAWIGLKILRFHALRIFASESDSNEFLVYKYMWSNWHRDLGQLAMDVLGVRGDICSDDDLNRRLQQVYFFSRADTIYAGTNEIQLNMIAERGLQMPKDKRG